MSAAWRSFPRGEAKRRERKTVMKYMITGAEPRGESDRLDPEELNRRIRHHQQALDELLRARVRGGKTGLIFASVGLGPDRETVTVKNRGGKRLQIDGPFPETRE